MPDDGPVVGNSMTDTQTYKMLSRCGLTFLVVLALLVWTVSASGVDTLGPQLDGPEVQVADLNGDSSPPDPALIPASGLPLPDLASRPFFSPSLGFHRAPVRLLSYPCLSQGPPALV